MDANAYSIAYSTKLIQERAIEKGSVKSTVYIKKQRQKNKFQVDDKTR